MSPGSDHFVISHAFVADSTSFFLKHCLPPVHVSNSLLRLEADRFLEMCDSSVEFTLEKLDTAS